MTSSFLISTVAAERLAPTTARLWTHWNRHFNTLRPKQNVCHFQDDIFKCIILNENVWISMKISLKFVPRGQIKNIPSLVKIMPWRRPAQSHYLNQWWLVYWCIYTSLGLDTLWVNKGYRGHCGKSTKYNSYANTVSRHYWARPPFIISSLWMHWKLSHDARVGASTQILSTSTSTLLGMSTSTSTSTE